MSNEAVNLGPLPGIENVDAEEVGRSLTGFDEVAIKRAFGASIGDLPETIIMRALLFVLLRRDGVKDSNAHKACMELPLGEVSDKFIKPEGKEPGSTSP